MIAAPSTRTRWLHYEPHLLVALFALRATVVLARHEMWMDELNPWVIARDAHSLRQLLFNMRFEPHPGLARVTRFVAGHWGARPSSAVPTPHAALVDRKEP